MATKAKKPAPAATEPRASIEETSKEEAGKAAQAAEAAAPAAFPRLDYEILAGLSRDQVATLVASSLALSNGFEAIGKELIDLGRTTVEGVNRTAEALLGARTINEIVELNTALARTQLEGLLLRSAKLSELSAAVAKEALAPFEGAVDAVFATLTKPRVA